MAEQEADFCSGRGQYEMALKLESGEEGRREHTPALLNTKLLQQRRADFSVQGLLRVTVVKEDVCWWLEASVSS